MPLLAHHASVFAFAALLATTGCAERLSLLARSGGRPPPYLFWPPPQPTSIWTTDSSAFSEGSLRDAAARVATALRDAGYEEDRMYPVGVDYAHGFAVTTRLERIDDDGAPTTAAERWLPQYPKGTDLAWLTFTGSRAPLPSRGRYRIFLVALTDLSIGPSNRAPLWNERTVMAGLDLPAMSLPTLGEVPRSYRLGVYVYEFEAKDGSSDGELLPSDLDLPAEVHVKKSGLAALARLPSQWRHADAGP